MDQGAGPRVAWLPPGVSLCSSPAGPLLLNLRKLGSVAQRAGAVARTVVRLGVGIEERGLGSVYWRPRVALKGRPASLMRGAGSEVCLNRGECCSKYKG